MRLATLMSTEGTLIESLGNPVPGPDLTMMGVPRELKIDTCSLGLFQAVGLMVEQQDVGFGTNGPHEFVEGTSARIRAVITPDDGQPMELCDTIPQQMNTRITEETLGSRLASEVLVITQASIDGRLQPTKLFCHVFLHKRAIVMIDDVACDKYDVWVFSIYEINPAGQFGTTIVVT